MVRVCPALTSGKRRGGLCNTPRILLLKPSRFDLHLFDDHLFTSREATILVSLPLLDPVRGTNLSEQGDKKESSSRDAGRAPRINSSTSKTTLEHKIYHQHQMDDYAHHSVASRGLSMNMEHGKPTKHKVTKSHLDSLLPHSCSIFRRTSTL